MRSLIVFKNSVLCVLRNIGEKERSVHEKGCDWRAVWIESDITYVLLGSTENRLLPATMSFFNKYHIKKRVEAKHFVAAPCKKPFLGMCIIM